MLSNKYVDICKFMHLLFLISMEVRHYNNSDNNNAIMVKQIQWTHETRHCWMIGRAFCITGNTGNDNDRQ